ncbi:MAG: tRNA (N6-isopentenyl adenosine(37)-C2)-methylthiotransferase MiaB [Bdellovibrionales bacterium]
MKKRKVFIHTWGCQMNAYDSGRMADVVAPLGYALTGDADSADLVIFNTCHIREKATEKLYSELGRLRPLQEAKAAKGERMLLAVAGCVAQAEGAEIQRRAPYVDIVFGPQTYAQLPEMIAHVMRKSGGVLNTDFPAQPKFDSLPEHQTSGVSAFLAIQEGCDKFCTYCVVPYTRGAEYSRAPQAILAEGLNLVAKGAREITVLGQNVNAFHGEDKSGKTWNLTRLLSRLAEIPEILRLRTMTSHPLDMDDELIAAHRDIPKLMPFLHLPVQSGSNAVLKAMNRKHTRDDYRKLADKLRAARPDIALSSDFIVGFPGETDADFKDTLALVRDIGFAQAFSFKYSRRAGTPAAGMKNQIPEEVMDARLQELQNLLHDQQTKFNESMVGKTISVLFDDNGQHKGQVFGRTPYLQPTFIEAPPEVRAQINGREINVKITEALPNNLKGKILKDIT